MARQISNKIGIVVGEKLTPEEIDGTYIIDSDTLELSFVIHADENEFEVRNIKLHKPGLGAEVLHAIHEFCDEHGFSVVASNVRDKAEGFWKKVGYQEGSGGQYYRPE